MKKHAPIQPPRAPSGFASESELVPARRKLAASPEPVKTRYLKPDRHSKAPQQPQSAQAPRLAPRPAKKPTPTIIQKNEAAPRVYSAEFALGVTTLSQLPQDDLPQVAFFGRSNVGKSSLLSALLGKKGLVKISAAPGKTREINFFRVNEAFYFVDLPGIGYAKVSISKRDEMAEMIREYVEHSENLRGIIYLVDMRLCGTPLDIQTVEILRGLGKPVLLVACKRDKLNQGEASKASQEIQRRFALEEPPLETSAVQKFGFDTLWEQIFEAVSLKDPVHGR